MNGRYDVYEEQRHALRSTVDCQNDINSFDNRIHALAPLGAVVTAIDFLVETMIEQGKSPSEAAGVGHKVLDIVFGIEAVQGD